jgi:hypothetical protein
VRRRVQQTTVKLVGITARRQGSHDALCAYYAAATLLCALRPELSDAFECVDARSDPLFGSVRRRPGERVEKVVASWFTGGLELRKVTAAMNRVGRGATTTAFGHRILPRARASYDALCARIDEGLPSLLAWEGREIGSHAVVVVGYDRHAGSPRRWLRILDPIHMQEVLEWGQLATLSQAPIEAVICTRHGGTRPDKLTTFRDGRQKLLVDRTLHERFDPRGRSYELVLGRR